MAHISAVIPVYHEELLMDELASRVCSALGSVTNDFEVVFVDDGSSDGTWAAITRIAEQEPRVRGLRFSRNFGQHYAITAGLDDCDGDWVVVMDGDLQDRPEVIPDLYAKAQEGYDVVFVARQNRPEKLHYRIVQRIFYWTFKTLALTDYNPEHGNFSIVSRRVIEAIRSMRETARFYGGIVHWLGFKRSSIPAQHGDRAAGVTQYTLRKRIQLALSIILAHSERPLSFSIGLGLTMAVLSVGYATFVLVRATFFNFSVEGWASLMMAIFFTGGTILTTLGIIGIYVGKLFSELKGRPLYVVADRVGPDVQRTTGQAVGR
jgi:dolichol-phosphate mannosyltransferase